MNVSPYLEKPVRTPEQAQIERDIRRLRELESRLRGDAARYRNQGLPNCEHWAAEALAEASAIARARKALEAGMPEE